MPLLRPVSGYGITDHVRNTTIRNALQTYAFEERIQVYKHKWHNHILRFPYWPKSEELPTQRTKKESLRRNRLIKAYHEEDKVRVDDDDDDDDDDDILLIMFTSIISSPAPQAIP
jgi:hypothetical protein